MRRMARDASPVETRDLLFDAVVVAGAGLVGAFGCEFAATYSHRLIVLDDDTISFATTLLPPYARKDIGQPKSQAISRYLRSRFGHLNTAHGCAGLVQDVRRIGLGFWRAVARRGRSVVISCLDNPESVAAVCSAARDSGVASVVAQVSGNGVEVLVFPASREAACYQCTGRAPGLAAPCLGRRAEAAPTGSSPEMGAMSAAFAVRMAVQLAGERIGRALDLRLAFADDGSPKTFTAEIERARGCLEHRPPDSRAVEDLALTTRHSWDDVAAHIWDNAAKLILRDLPPVVAGSREAKRPLEELGVPLWPIVSCESRGKARLIELTGDCGRLGLTQELEAHDDG